MNQKNTIKGFSLVELIVVIAIIATLSVSSFVGFGYLGDTLKVKEVASLLQDTVKQEELKILRGDFTKSTIHFLKDYMVIDEEVEGATLSLKFLEAECTSPGSGYQMQYDEAEASNLIKNDKDGASLGIESVTKNDKSGCIDFTQSKDIENAYQLISSGKYSNIIRFVHFNIKRDSSSLAEITEAAKSKIEIRAPYGKKYIYKGDGTSVNNVTIKVNVKGQTEGGESFILQ